ncbi:hypothetical protein LSUE1_G009427 [Lachnellula suecica]|uniref:Phosphatidylglycerol lysyltransferase C-terminal domain-containing protein n=1 Tax=Lachnellula suecica TaxID=602035 RepID=A0A8T9BTF0_9HELO|nr:hypothetical protein LSUE1_G009427 [Lachnellula suecica]
MAITPRSQVTTTCRRYTDRVTQGRVQCHSHDRLKSLTPAPAPAPVLRGVLHESSVVYYDHNEPPLSPAANLVKFNLINRESFQFPVIVLPALHIQAKQQTTATFLVRRTFFFQLQKHTLAPPTSHAATATTSTDILVNMSSAQSNTETPMIGPTIGPEGLPVKANTKAKKATKKGNATPKPPPKPAQTFAEKIGSDLANGLVKDPKSLKQSLNLIDRVTFVKLPTATKTNPTTNTNTTLEEELSILSPRTPTQSEIQSRSSDEFGSASSVEFSTADAAHNKQHKKARQVFDLNDFTALASLQELIGRHGRVSHMGILDPSYTFFITKDRTAALYYKVKNKIAVVGGDPLCPLGLFPKVLAEFEMFRKKHGFGIAFMGAGETFVEYIRTQKWTTMCFATERVLNPMTNPVLHGKAGKSITRTSRNLLDPKKEGLTLEVYTPLLGKNAALQQQLVNVYEEWRDHRNDSKRPQAYITVYDPFALPELMTYIYTKDRSGTPNGFAALRILGSNKGYHLDPYVATPGAPKGITDLLLYSAMALLNTAQISYLSLGYEPLDDLGDIQGMHSSMAKISRKVHKKIFQGLHVAGKKDYHDKFHPDETQQSNLYLVFPPGIPSIRHMSGIVHVANIKLREVIFGMATGTGKSEADAPSEKSQEKTEQKTSPVPSIVIPTDSHEKDKVIISTTDIPEPHQDKPGAGDKLTVIGSLLRRRSYEKLSSLISQRKVQEEV